MRLKLVWLIAGCCLLTIYCSEQKTAEVKTEGGKQPVIVITDCYFPYQDPGDNLDLIQGFALQDIELLGVILDISKYFRKDTADHPTLWKDPRGPREAGIIPVEQLKYIFNKNVPYAVGPLSMMKSENDQMMDAPGYEQAGVELLLRLLRESPVPVEVLSFGAPRVVAVAFNRDSALMKAKVKRVHVSAGTASKNHVLGSDAGANMIPGGEWNVALDVFAFTRMLRCDLPVALYPCAGKDGGFVKDTNSTFYALHDMSFLRRMHPKLQCYLDYAFDMKKRYDFLQEMDNGAPYSEGKKIQFEKFMVWETAIWLEVLDKALVESSGTYLLKNRKDTVAGDKVLESGLRACKFTEVRNDGRFQFEYTTTPSNFSIYTRGNLDENEKAMNAIVPAMYISHGAGLK